MTRILITGGKGFLARNLAEHLQQRNDCDTRSFVREDSVEYLENLLLESDVIFHLAAVNRSADPEDFANGNSRLTKQICQFLQKNGRSPKVVFSSSIEAGKDFPYGVSKAEAENTLRQFASESGASVKIYRLNNLFGKWSRPNYNSVTATFCYNISHGLPITVSDPLREIELSYVDHVVAALSAEIHEREAASNEGAQIPKYRIQLRDLANRIQDFHDLRAKKVSPESTDWFDRALYTTYLSYASQ